MRDFSLEMPRSKESAAMVAPEIILNFWVFQQTKLNADVRRFPNISAAMISASRHL
jgi:hypothetical protein